VSDGLYIVFCTQLLSGIVGALESWVGSPIEERTSNGTLLVQHKSLAEPISTSDRQELMITGTSYKF